MFRLAGKGFAAVKRGCEVRHKAVAHGGSATRGLFAFLSVDIAQLKSTSVVTREHNRLRRKGSAPMKVNREGFERARNLSADFERPPIVRTPPLYGLFELIVSRVYFRFQIQSYVSLLTVRRLIELTRNPRIRFQIVRCNFIHNHDSCTIRTLDFNFAEILFEIYLLQKLKLIIDKLEQVYILIFLL